MAKLNNTVNELAWWDTVSFVNIYMKLVSKCYNLQPITQMAFLWSPGRLWLLVRQDVC